MTRWSGYSSIVINTGAGENVDTSIIYAPNYVQLHFVKRGKPKHDIYRSSKNIK